MTEYDMTPDETHGECYFCGQTFMGKGDKVFLGDGAGQAHKSCYEREIMGTNYDIKEVKNGK